MDLDGLFHGTEIIRDLLVQLSVANMREDFALARRKRCQTFLDFIQLGATLPFNAIFLEGGVNGFKEVFVMNGLGKEIHRAALHRLYAHGNVAPAGKENDRKRAAFRCQSLLQLQAVQAWHRDIEHETSSSPGIVLLQKFAG